MVHETRVVVGGASRASRLVYDWFCTCGEFGINYDAGSVSIFSESHKRVGNAHDPSTCRNCLANRNVKVTR